MSCRKRQRREATARFPRADLTGTIRKSRQGGSPPDELCGLEFRATAQLCPAALAGRARDSLDRCSARCVRRGRALAEGRRPASVLGSGSPDSRCRVGDGPCLRPRCGPRCPLGQGQPWGSLGGEPARGSGCLGRPGVVDRFAKLDRSCGPWRDRRDGRRARPVAGASRPGTASTRGRCARGPLDRGRTGLVDGVVHAPIERGCGSACRRWRRTRRSAGRAGRVATDSVGVATVQPSRCRVRRGSRFGRARLERSGQRECRGRRRGSCQRSCGPCSARDLGRGRYAAARRARLLLGRGCHTQRRPLGCGCGRLPECSRRSTVDLAIDGVDAFGPRRRCPPDDAARPTLAGGGADLGRSLAGCGLPHGGHRREQHLYAHPRA